MLYNKQKQAVRSHALFTFRNDERDGKHLKDKVHPEVTQLQACTAALTEMDPATMTFTICFQHLLSVSFIGVFFFFNSLQNS